MLSPKRCCSFVAVHGPIVVVGGGRRLCTWVRELSLLAVGVVHVGGGRRAVQTGRSRAVTEGRGGAVQVVLGEERRKRKREGRGRRLRGRFLPDLSAAYIIVL
jgi:hypothetical protein